MSRLASSEVMGFGADLAPTFDLEIEGKSAGEYGPLFRAVRPLIKEVTWEEDEEMASMLTIEVVNQPDVEFGRPADWRAVLDSKIFSEGNRIDLWMGYGGFQFFMGRASIVRWLPRFPSDGPTTFTIKAYDARHEMGLGNKFKSKKKGKAKRKTYYTNLPDHDIVKKIAAKYGYACDADPTSSVKHSAATSATTNKAVFPTRVQPADTSDWEFLTKLAEINFYDLGVYWDSAKRRNVVSFKKRQHAGTPQFEFTYSSKDGSLLEAEPDFVVTEQATTVDVLFFDRGSTYAGKATASDTKPAEAVRLSSAGVGRLAAQKSVGIGARVRFSAYGQVYEAHRNKPFQSKAEATAFAKGWLQERERDLLIVRGAVVGLPTLKPRQFHRLSGMSARTDGTYRFAHTRQIMSLGSLWRCEFVAHKVPDIAVARGTPTMALMKGGV